MSSVLALYHSGEMMRDYDNALSTAAATSSSTSTTIGRTQWECIHCHSIMDRTNFTHFIKESE
jgi:hypothetical protein